MVVVVSFSIFCGVAGSILQIRSGIRSLLKLKISAAAEVPRVRRCLMSYTRGAAVAVVRLATAATHVDELPLHTLLLGVVVEKAPTSVGRNPVLG